MAHNSLGFSPKLCINYCRKVLLGICRSLGGQTEWIMSYWKMANTPFYSCLLSDLAFEWQQGCRIPFFDTDFTAFVVQIEYSVLPPCQNKPKCETVVHVKMSSAYRFIFMQIKLIFIRKVLHVLKQRHKGTQKWPIILMHQSNVSSSLVCIHRPGNQAHNCKMAHSLLLGGLCWK